MLTSLCRPSRLPWLLVLLLSPALAGCGVGGLVDDLAASYRDLGRDPLPEGGTPAAMSEAERAFAMEVLRLVNEERAQASLGALAWNEPVAVVAYGHSVDMDARDFFAHVNPSGQDPGARLASAGVTGLTGYGENIARGQRTPADVMRAWMNSAGHRANILNGGFTHLGVGVHSGGDIWWTQLFVAE